MVASEALPFAKTGGLADVLGALPPALGRLGWDATVVLPRYRGMDAGGDRRHVPARGGGYAADVTLHRVTLAERAHAILVDVPELYDREGIYGTNSVDFWDNPRRFAVLARAALEYAARSDGAPPTIVHGHDWHAGLAARVPEDTVRVARAAGRRAGRVHHPQSGVSGQLRRRLAAAPRFRLGHAVGGPHGVLGTDELFEGRHHLRRLTHHRESDVREGDSGGVRRFRFRRHSPRAAAGPDGHLERDRRRAVECAA